jgi:hypothetical protein
VAIIRMINTRDPGEFREFQQRMVPVGKIRLGTYNGRYPEKLSTFRFTSEDGDKVRAAAAAYGGTAEQWTPQGSKTPQWEVISEAKAIPVYLVNGQSLDPWYEAWAGGRTCVRRCDGVTNKITDTPCVCIPADGSAPKLAVKDLCKPTIRVQVMLVEVPGLGSWLMESHGENACAEISAFGPFVAAARTQIPAVLRLREENRREWNPNKKGGPGFESKSFYVPWFDISAITMQQVAVGGDALTQALRAAGGSAALGAGPAQAAIEARPVSAPVPPPAAAPDAPDVDKLRPMILADIELQETREGLDAIKEKLKARGINDRRVIDAWLSKANALTAAAGLAEVRRVNEAAIASGTTGRPYRVLVTGSRTWTDAGKLEEQLGIALMTHRGRMVLVSGACPTGADRLAEEWAERNDVPVERYPADWDGQGKSAGFARNQAMVATFPDIVLSFNRGESKGTEHCTAAAEAAGLKVLRFTDDTPIEREAPRLVTGIEKRVTDPRLDALTGGREFFADDLPQYDEAVSRGASHRDIVEAGGPAHWLATDDQDRAYEAAERGAHREDYRVGDTVTFGGIEFTKIREMPRIEDMLFADPGEAVEGAVEAAPGRVALPDVPTGDYDADELYTMLMTGASQQNPPLTTKELNALILRTFPAAAVELVGGYELARLRAGLKSGAVQWRQ